MKFLFLVFAASFSACASYQVPPLSATHPANPSTASAAIPPSSKTLAYTPVDIPSPRPALVTAATQGGPENHHAQANPQKTVTGEGKVVATVPGTSQLVVEHGEIKDFMEPMTMGYRVEPASLLDGLKAGDRVRFAIDVPKKTIVKIEKIK